MEARYPCPCCGYVVFSEPPDSYELCPICSWQDEALHLQFPTSYGQGGANHITLAEAQRNFLAYGASKPYLTAFVRRPTPFDRRDVGWRPIDETLDRFSEFSWTEPVEARLDETLYYWRDNPTRDAPNG